MGRIRATAVIALCLLPGCLTEMLWSGVGEYRTPPLELVSILCDVHDVRTRPATATDEAELLVQFSAPAVPGAPSHLARYPADRPGWMTLRPPPHDDGYWRAVPGAERFVPATWALRVTNGAYFSTPWAHARVVHHGRVAASKIGRVPNAGDVPPDLAERTTPLQPTDGPVSAEARCLEAFARHDWKALLTDSKSRARYRATPLCWTGPDGQPLAEPPVAAIDADQSYRRARPDVALCHLLGRVESPYGEAYLVEIPVPVLLQGDRLTMRRSGDAIAWTREEIWRASLETSPPDVADLAVHTLPLFGSGFAYRWGREVPQDETLAYAWRVLLTPFTAVLDALITTNPALRRLYDFLRGKEPARQPQGGR